MLSLSASTAFSEEPEGLWQTLSAAKDNHAPYLKSPNVTASGWATIGYTQNVDHPKNKSNSPVSFNDRSNEFNLHQLNFYLERTIMADGHFNVGGRFDAMFGTDTPYTQATGLDNKLVNPQDFRLYDIALPQVYLEFSIPGINGLSAKFGHFYSILGYESVGAPGNFFYSHSYSMKSSPFTHTGVLLSYALQPHFTLYSGAVAGADNFDQQFGAWSFLGGFNWTLNDDDSGWQFAVLNGDTNETINNNLTYLSTAWRQKITPKLHAVLQHDHGWQAQAYGLGTNSTEWYSVVGYMNYDLRDKLGIGIRGEWFNDRDGFRYNIKNADYFAVTVGMNWKPQSWLMLRPEIRIDWANSATPAYIDQLKNHQLTIGIDATVHF